MKRAQQIVRALQQRREALLSNESNQVLSSYIRKHLNSITPNFYILRWIPEQAEDLYDLLVDGDKVIHVEISRLGNADHNFHQVWTVEQYLHSHQDMTKVERRRSI